MYQLKQDPQIPGEQALFEDDRPRNCPFQSPIVIQEQGKIHGGAQRMQMIFRPCGTWCALFVKKESANRIGEIEIDLNCGDGSLIEYVQEEKAPESPLKLV